MATSTSLQNNNNNNNTSRIKLKVLLVGKQTELDCSLDDTIGDVCNLLLQKHANGAQNKRVRLIWRGRILCGDAYSQRTQTLRSCGIDADAVVHAQISDVQQKKKQRRAQSGVIGGAQPSRRRNHDVRHQSLMDNIRANLARLSSARAPNSNLALLFDRQARIRSNNNASDNNRRVNHSSDSNNRNQDEIDLEAGQNDSVFDDLSFSTSLSEDEDDDNNNNHNNNNRFLFDDDDDNDYNDSDSDSDASEPEGFDALRRYGLAPAEIAAMRADFHRNVVTASSTLDRRAMLSAEEAWMREEARGDDAEVLEGVRVDGARRARLGSEEDLIVGMLAGFTLSVLSLFLVLFWFLF
jgi:hypothetical protein